MFVQLQWTNIYVDQLGGQVTRPQLLRVPWIRPWAESSQASASGYSRLPPRAPTGWAVPVLLIG